MKNHLFATLLFIAGLGIISLILNPSSDAAVALTKRGPREGKVIVREFDRLVITIVTPEKRVFQYYARDVESITATEKILIGEKTPLRKTPNENGETITDFSRGLEISIMEKSPDRQWIKVKGWGNNEGWIPITVLTDNVIFTPEEKQESKTQPAGAGVQTATPALASATSTLQTATPALQTASPTIQTSTASVQTEIPSIPIVPIIPGATGSGTIQGATAGK